MGRINYKMRTQLKISLSREISSHTMIESRFNDILEPFLIDYINVYQYIGDSNSPDGNFPDPKRWATSWSNRNDECFNGNWKPREIDKFFSGNFNSLNSNKDELLIFRNDNSPDSVILMDDYIKGGIVKWEKLYYSSNGRFGDSWNIGTQDKLVVGNFIDDVNSGDDILLVSATKYAKLISFYGIDNKMHDIWGNGGPDSTNAGWIGTWRIGAYDIFNCFDYNNDSIDDLLAISATKYCKILKYMNHNWVTIWGNGGNENGGHIGPWTINDGDSYYIGNFYNNLSGNELLCISSEGIANLLHFDGKKWILIGDTTFLSIFSKKIIVGDFNHNNDDEILIIDYITGKVSLVNLNHTLWINERNNDYIHNWHIDIDDKYAVGKFIDDTISGGYEHLLLIRGKALGDMNYFRAQMFLSPLYNDIWDPYLKNSNVVKSWFPYQDLSKSFMNNLIIYPNPSSSGVFYFNNELPISIELSNIKGEILLRKKVDINYILNISSLKSGIYFLSCNYANNYKTFKIVKSN